MKSPGNATFRSRSQQHQEEEKKSNAYEINKHMHKKHVDKLSLQCITNAKPYSKLILDITSSFVIGFQKCFLHILRQIKDIVLTRKYSAYL